MHGIAPGRGEGEKRYLAKVPMGRFARPVLVEYFVRRYAEKARKQISKIDKNALRLCQFYHLPGNIRELQIIIERSVILCTGDIFGVDEAWPQVRTHLARSHQVFW